MAQMSLTATIPVTKQVKLIYLFRYLFALHLGTNWSDMPV